MRVNSKFVKLKILTLGLVVNGWITPLYHFNIPQHQLGQERIQSKIKCNICIEAYVAHSHITKPWPMPLYFAQMV